MSVGFSQSRTVDELDALVVKIDNNPNLDSIVLDANEVYNQTFDGGGNYILFSIRDSLVKVRSEIGTSYGRFTTVLYLQDQIPLKIIEKEENFIWKDEDSSWDYSQINTVFKAVIYVTDYSNADTHTIKEGQRVLTEGACGLFEYDPAIERAKKLYNN